VSCENFKLTRQQAFFLQRVGREAFAESRDVILPTRLRSYCFAAGKAEEIWPKAAQKLPGSAREPNGQKATFQLLFSIKEKSLIPHTLNNSHGALEQIPGSAKARGETPEGFSGAAGVSQQSLRRSAGFKEGFKDLRLCTAPAKHLSTQWKLNVHFCVLLSREGQ